MNKNICGNFLIFILVSSNLDNEFERQYDCKRHVTTAVMFSASCKFSWNTEGE